MNASPVSWTRLQIRADISDIGALMLKNVQFLGAAGPVKSHWKLLLLCV